MKLRRLPLALAAVLASCAGSPQQLPVGLSLCNAVAHGSGFAVTATVQNKGEKPISALGLALSFYRDFRYSSYTASAQLRQELDPGEKRDVTFEVSGPQGEQSGEAMRCIVTHVEYMDGTSADLPPSQ
jgi:hypothetical protein